MTPRQRFDRLVSALRRYYPDPSYSEANIAVAFRHLSIRAECAGDTMTAAAARRMSRAWEQRSPNRPPCVH